MTNERVAATTTTTTTAAAAAAAWHRAERTDNERMVGHVGEDLALLVGVLDVAVLDDGALAHDLHGTDLARLSMAHLPDLVDAKQPTKQPSKRRWSVRGS